MGMETILKPNEQVQTLPDRAWFFKYRGRVVTQDDVAFIREMIAKNPTLSRRMLSRILCEAWNWTQANGKPKSMVCRGLMLALHRAGRIELPAKRKDMPNPFVNRVRPRLVHIDCAPVEGNLSDLGPLEIRSVRRTPEESLFNSLVETHHYLRYTQPVGEHLKYMVYAKDRPVACFAWCSAPRHLGPRDRFIGWPAQARRRNIHFVSYNTRFLILPWVRVRHLASHLLGRMTGLLSSDWERVYKHPVYFAETFVDPTRYPGTCYYAANWVFLGQTTGRGKNDQTGRPNRSIKDVLGYALTKDFRRLLSETL
jgi:hypothetical protein